MKSGPMETGQSPGVRKTASALFNGWTADLSSQTPLPPLPSAFPAYQDSPGALLFPVISR